MGRKPLQGDIELLTGDVDLSTKLWVKRGDVGGEGANGAEARQVRVLRSPPDFRVARQRLSRLHPGLEFPPDGEQPLRILVEFAE